MSSSNERQRDFYESRFEATGNREKAAGVLTNVWTSLRRSIIGWEQLTGIPGEVNQRHRDWVGECAKGRVLDVGCFTGNDLSLELARSSRDYLAVDLSPSAIAELQSKIDVAGIENARAVAADFFELGLPENSFDLIYARGVLHHFEDVDRLMAELHRLLNPTGVVVSHDPLATTLANRFARAIYRPFQSDSDWEWPFTSATLGTIEQYFNLDNVRGTRGLSKIGILPSVLRLKGLAVKLTSFGDAIDSRLASKNGWYLKGFCWYVSLKLSKKEIAEHR